MSNGLANNMIRCIYQDSRGFIWLGTESGLSLFDGEGFTNYNTKDGLASNSVWSITEDERHNLIIGCYGGGITYYNGKVFTDYIPNDSLNNYRGTKNIRKLFYDKNKTLYAGTENGLLIIKDGKIKRIYSKSNNKLDFNMVCTSVFEISNDSIYIHAYGNGEYVYVKNQDSLIKKSIGLSALSIKRDPYNKIYSCSHSVMNPNLMDRKKNTSFVGYHPAWDITQQNDSIFWIGCSSAHSNEGNLIRISGNRVEDMSKTYNIPYGIWSIHFDIKSKKLLVGSYNGLYVISSSPYSTLAKFVLSEENKYKVAFDKNGNTIKVFDDHFILGSKDISLDQYNNFALNKVIDYYSKLVDNFEFFTKDSLTAINFQVTNQILVSNIYQSNKKAIDGQDKEMLSNLKLSYLNQLKLLKSLRSKKKAFLTQFSGQIIAVKNGYVINCDHGMVITDYDFNPLRFIHIRTNQFLFYDNSDRLWARFSYSTLNCLNNISGKIIPVEYRRSRSNEIPADITDISEDDNKTIYFSTSNDGLFQFKNKKFKKVLPRTKEKVLENVTSVLCIKDNLIFTGYSDGSINIITNDQEFNLLTTINSNLNNNAFSVYSIKQDKSDLIWVFTDKGASVFDYPLWKKNKELKIYNISQFDGFDVQNEYTVKSSVSNDEFFIEDFKIISSMNPSLLSDLMYIKDSIIITNVLVHYKSYPWDSLLNFSEWQNFPNNIVLPYKDNHLQVFFRNYNLSRKRDDLYRTKLVGLDKDWTDFSKSEQVVYNNIPIGTFTLLIQCYNPFRTNDTKEYSLVIKIEPPWWKTKLFYSIAFLSLTFSVIVIVKLRERKYKKTQEILEYTVKLRTKEILEQKYIIEEKQKEIIDSINYAERIQRSFLASKELLDENLSDYFILFKPKDIVSGDFYWAAKLNNGNFAFVTADSTGHGVPGAIMSLLNITSLEKAIETETSPDKILNATRKTIIERLKKDGSIEGGKDGMDCSLISINKDKTLLQIACAHNPVWIMRGREVIDIKVDKMPVGKHERQNESFNLQELELQKGDVIYMLTDGFPDQFGGEKSKKFMSKKLRELLAKNAHLPLHEQKAVLEKTFADWVGELEQVDDVCLIGVRL